MEREHYVKELTVSSLRRAGGYLYVYIPKWVANLFTIAPKDKLGLAVDGEDIVLSRNSTGIRRVTVNRLGRTGAVYVYLPRFLVNLLGLKSGEKLKVYVRGEQIVYRR
jgi:antitoxin component of MazEF toxin-antitoxin module